MDKQELTEAAYLDNLRRLSARERVELFLDGDLKRVGQEIKTFIHDLDERVQYASFCPNGGGTMTTMIDGDTLTIKIRVRRIEDKVEQQEIIEGFNSKSHYQESK